MSELLGLPNELLLHIIKHVLPDDIESFSQICKSIHCLSKEVLREHAANKGKYSKLTLSTQDPTCQSPNSIDPLLMIRDILRNDRVAFYPVEVIIENSYDYWNNTESPESKPLGSESPGFPEKPENEVSKTLTQYSDEIFSLLSKCPYLDGSEVVEWHKNITERIDGGSAGASVALLLTILPNVEKITICHNIFDSTSLKEMIGRISRTSHSLPFEVRRLTPLGKVTSFTLVSDIQARMSVPKDNADLSLLGLFATLPSIRSIHGRRLDSQEFRPQQNLEFLFVPYSPSLREFHFTNSSIHPYTLNHLCSRMKTLQRFSYSYESFMDTVASLFFNPEPRKMVALLQSCAKSKLVELEIAGCYPRIARPYFINGKSFRAFKVLELIRVDAEMFMGLFQHRNRTPQLLTNLLPASVKELELASAITEAEARVMFAWLSNPDDKSLPNLRKIVFRGVIPLSETMQAECKAAGISLEAKGHKIDDQDPMLNMLMEMENAQGRGYR